MVEMPNLCQIVAQMQTWLNQPKLTVQLYEKVL